MMRLSTLQAEVAEWSRRNFGNQPAYRSLLGAVEEVGELAHAFLKREQGIRGTAEAHVAAEKDAVGDTVIYLADFCERRGFSLDDVVKATWALVKQRDWRNDPEGTGAGHEAQG